MKKEVENKKEELIIDAEGKSLGRVATMVATSLMGKDSPFYERNKFSGRPVKVVNSSKIKITNKKLDSIKHKRYSGYPGGLRVMSASHTIGKKGWSEVVRLAVRKMLPSNKLRREMMKNLVVEN